MSEAPLNEPEMSLEEFERAAERIWASIPEALKEGVVGLVIDPEVGRDPEFQETPLLGECRIDPAVAMAPGAPIRSLIQVFYGSFIEVAAREPDFDWHDELEETIRHELRHHLDWREGHDALGAEDDLQRENMLRLRGLPFDTSFHRYAERLADAVTILDRELFVEARVARSDWSDVLAKGACVEIHGFVFVTQGDIDASDTVVYVPVEDVREPPSDVQDDAAQKIADADWKWASVVFVRRGWIFRRRPGVADVRPLENDA